ncbi:hypothetical protein [Streptomyces griseus]|uniref:hypothetical protein n=1 Tax=Streptomyces griseus TaxID=1911 RepID=UPI000A3996A3|nr:hypothetical protein [Streptomyces fimicarius]
MTPATAINLSTLAVIVVLFALHIRSFIKGGKDPKILMSSIGGMISGSSLAMCTGGALGAVASWIAGGTNAVAIVAPWATGTGDRTLTSGTPQGLSLEGGLIALTVGALSWVSIRDASKKERIRQIGGLICGVCLTYTGGYGGLVNSTLVPLYNGIGGQVVSLVENWV